MWPPADWTPREAAGSLFQRRECALQEGRECLAGRLDRRIRLTERGELRHLQSRVTAGIDALKRLEVHVHVEREAVITRAAADAQADAGDLATIDVDTRRVLAALGADAEAGTVVDHGAFQHGDEVAHAEPRAADVDEWIDHELAGAVIGDLPAAIDLHDGNVAGREHVAGVAVQTLCEHRRMLEQPDLVRRVRIARVGDALHLAPGRDVLDLAEPANSWWKWGHS